jgi:hypothetical protein
MKIPIKELRTFEMVIQEWGHSDEVDPDLAITYKKDKIELHKVLNRLKKGDIKGAKKLIDDMDTIVRDVIPESLYNKLYKDN